MLGRELARAAHGILDAGKVLEDVYVIPIFSHHRS